MKKKFRYKKKENLYYGFIEAIDKYDNPYEMGMIKFDRFDNTTGILYLWLEREIVGMLINYDEIVEEEF